MQGQQFSDQTTNPEKNYFFFFEKAFEKPYLDGW